MKVKIQNKKVLYEKGRIICNGKGMSIKELYKIVRDYLWLVKQIKATNNIEIHQEIMNQGIRFKLFNIYCTVGKLFELYNEVASINNKESILDQLPIYSKLWYNPKESKKFSPSNLG
jgi:hypothetical protein